MLFTQIWTITRNTFTESVRQPIYVVILIIAAIILVLNPSLSCYTLDDDDKMMIDIGLSAMLLFGVILAAFIASGVLAREISDKTVLTVISKPISRPTFIVGKFLGVTGAVTLASWIWSLTFLLTVRHQVMESSADKLDMPVIAFGISALVLALIISFWGNYFYNWIFASTFTAVLALSLTLTYLLVLIINKQWQFQPITTEFNSTETNLVQLMMAMVLVAETLWALCAIAVACSTRLGQMMTLLICLGMFLFGGIVQYTTTQLVDSSSIVVRITAHILRAITPDIQVLFMSDALTQKHPFGATYMALATAYIALYVLAMLAIATALFQTREAD